MHLTVGVGAGGGFSGYEWKFTTIFFIHLKCYGNTHQTVRAKGRGTNRERERESDREGEQTPKERKKAGMKHSETKRKQVTAR